MAGRRQSGGGDRGRRSRRHAAQAPASEPADAIHILCRQPVPDRDSRRVYFCTGADRAAMDPDRRPASTARAAFACRRRRVAGSMRRRRSVAAGEFWAEVGRDWLRTREGCTGADRASRHPSGYDRRTRATTSPGPARAGSGSADRRNRRFASGSGFGDRHLRQLLRRRWPRTPSPPEARPPRRCRISCAGRGSPSSTSPYR